MDSLTPDSFTMPTFTSRDGEHLFTIDASEPLTSEDDWRRLKRACEDRDSDLNIMRGLVLAVLHDLCLASHLLEVEGGVVDRLMSKLLEQEKTTAATGGE